MNYYWAIIIIVIESMATLFLASRYAVDLKHSYDPDYNPPYRVNLPEVLFIGALFGSLGLILSYIFLKPIRKEDSLNSHLFLGLSILFLALHIGILYLLIRNNVIVGI